MTQRAIDPTSSEAVQSTDEVAEYFDRTFDLGRLIEGEPARKNPDAGPVSDDQPDDEDEPDQLDDDAEESDDEGDDDEETPANAGDDDGSDGAQGDGEPPTLAELAAALKRDPKELAKMVVEIDGANGKERVSIEELQGGYLRQSDYTKKTQAVQDERRNLEAERTQQQERLGDWYNELETQGRAMAVVLEQTAQGLQQQYQQGQVSADDYLQQMESLRQEAAHIQSVQQGLKQQADTVRKRFESEQQYATERFVKERYPDFGETDRQKIVKKLGEFGYSEDIASRVVKMDPLATVAAKKFIEMEEQLAERDALIAKLKGTRSADKRVKARPAPTGRRSQQIPPSRGGKATKAARKNLSESGSVEAAAALFNRLGVAD